MPKIEGAKYKSLLVAKYLMENCDETNTVCMNDILDYLENDCGIPAKRRSVYRDIEALRSELGFEIKEEKVGRDYGYAFFSRPLKFEELHILAECVYASKFLSEHTAKELVGKIASLGTFDQAEKLEAETFLAERGRTTQTGTMKIINTIKSAMAEKKNGEKCVPTKISFHYMKYDIDNLEKQKKRYGGKKYTVSPYLLIINDGFYYLLAYSDSHKEMRTYRVDRMKDVEIVDRPREGEKEFEKINVKDYTRQVFNMYGGKKQRVTMQFDNHLLDAVIDRFGTKNDVRYLKADENHFTLNTEVEISEPFYGWLLGLGEKAKLISPKKAVQQFAEYLDTIRQMY